ncbi:cytochrome P450 [Roridomyces roridus]|uniref:Cytochrome P450 n=1 Tax=Roridomyces roridus TaxID=1738132 RepID=A0AAD7CG94_9AGAR|nr:cytochrome P450 [Roridomyces roridus]
MSATMTLPPGIRFLCRTLFIPTLSILLLQAFVPHSAYGLPVSVIALLLAVAFLATRTVFTAIARSMEAKAMGARPVPCAKGTWPGSVDLLRKLLASYKSGYFGETFSALVESLGPAMNIRILWKDKIFTSAPEHIQIILATDYKNYIKGQHFRDANDSVLGNGVFNSDGEMWSFHRSMTRPYFSRDRVQHFDIFDRQTERAIAHIRRRMVEGYAIDFQDIISRMTMDSATEFLFGACVDSLSCIPPYPHYAPANLAHESPRAKEANDFIEAYGDGMVQIAFRQRVGWIWPLFEMFGDKTAKSMAIVANYIDPIIHAALEKKRIVGEDKTSFDSGEQTSLLDSMLQSTSDPKLLKDEILNILLAGKDTTMNVLTNVIYFLARSPKVTARLREEILEVVGATERPTYENIKRMKYLKAVLNETMRLYPPVPFNVRESVKATTWPSPDPNEKPLYIPAGVNIVYSVITMHRRPDLWGPDADEWDPERFLDERAKKYITHHFQFLPFNAGPRVCLGQQFAYNEMSFVLIRLLQSFSSFTLDVDACPPDARVPSDWSGQPGRKGVEQFVPKAHLTMYTLGGLWVKMTDAQDS